MARVECGGLYEDTRKRLPSRKNVERQEVAETASLRDWILRR